MVMEILKKCWEDFEKDLYPKDRRMQILEKENIGGMNTENIRFLFNEIVKKYAKNGVYLEVGVFKGSSLLSSALFNPATRCIGIDNFSQFNPEGKNQRTLIENISKLDYPKWIEIHNGDYRQVIKDLFSKEPDLKVNVYFYDGEHSYENQLNGLKIILPYLAPKCIIIIDDFNWEQVERANKDFIRENPDFKSIFQIRTESIHSKNWWNGIEILARGFET